GWHHGRIIAGSPLTNNTAPIYFYIDDMVNPACLQNSASTFGFNIIEINTGSLTTLGYFDDVSFALAVPPNITINKNGNNAVLTWPGSGWTLQSATNVLGPYIHIGGPNSSYSSDTTTNSPLFYRLRN